MFNVDSYEAKRILELIGDNEKLNYTFTEISKKENNSYNRGILHGFLLSLVAQDIIESWNARELLLSLDK